MMTDLEKIRFGLLSWSEDVRMLDSDTPVDGDLVLDLAMDLLRYAAMLEEYQQATDNQSTTRKIK